MRAKGRARSANARSWTHWMKVRDDDRGTHVRPRLSERTRESHQSIRSVHSREGRWSEWDSGAADSPAHIMGYGSPTVLVEGKGVAEHSTSGAGASCRLYRRDGGRFDGAPSVEQIVAALSSRKGADIAPRDGWKSSLTAVPGIAFASLPKLVCRAANCTGDTSVNRYSALTVDPAAGFVIFTAGCTVIVSVGGLGSLSPTLSAVVSDVTEVPAVGNVTFAVGNGITVGFCTELAVGFPFGNTTSSRI
jgi:hypothetical protein